jgi:RNA polymerase sigma-70 factor (ECF subfamily)
MSSFAIDVPAALIARFQRREVAAFEQIYRWFERPAYTLAKRLLDDAEEAREVLHDALLRAWEQSASYRGDSPFWGWLRQITVNEALMRIRRRRVDYFDEVPEDFSHAVAVEAFAIDRLALEQALATLSPTTRVAVWLHLVEGYGHDEIGRMFERTPSFSKSQVSRGVRRLRESLATPSTELRHERTAATL